MQILSVYLLGSQLVKKADEGIVEIKLRRTGETLEVKTDELLNSIKILLKEDQGIFG